jgi:hypothetical protein
MQSLTSKTIHHLIASSLAYAGATIAGAVNVSTDGMGEALIYPYYTVRASQSTLITVTNNDLKSKAIKVLFREGKNGTTVLSFNLFLSPNDTWSSALVQSAEGARLVTNDKSCTNPPIPSTGVEFRNGGYVADGDALTNLDRTREGYFEIVEMASIAPDSVTDVDIRPNASGERTCAQVTNFAVAANASNFIVPSGKLSGMATLVSASMSTGYEATALQGLDNPALVTAPSTEAPAGFLSARSKTALITSSTSERASQIFAEFDSALDAVSAVLTVESLRGGYSAESAFTSDWIVSFPTKRGYTNRPVGESTGPFTGRWNPTTAKACETAPTSLVNREGIVVTAPSLATTELCFATSAVAFQRANQAVTSPLASQNAITIPIAANAASESGTAQISLVGNSNQTPRLRSKPTSRVIFVEPSGAVSEIVGAVDFYGLPAIGWSVANALLSNRTDNYNSSYRLTATRRLP